MGHSDLPQGKVTIPSFTISGENPTKN